MIYPKYDALNGNLSSIKFDAFFGVYRRLGENTSRMGIFKKVAPDCQNSLLMKVIPFECERVKATHQSGAI